VSTQPGTFQQWTSYVEGMKAYQGALSKRDKAQVQAAFRAKVEQALTEPFTDGAQDWEGVRLIVGAILNAFGKTTP
jgi:hypothetical protein